jgi:sugar phosphate isomerase/epimerase
MAASSDRILRRESSGQGFLASGDSAEGRSYATEFKRREWLAAGTAMIAGGLVGAIGEASGLPGSGTAQARTMERQAPEPFLLGLNTSTIRGQKLSIVEEVAIAAQAGYRGMEPWIDELEKYAASGGSLEDLAKRFRDAGISVESAIGFFEWIVDDPARRRRGLEAARRGMELVRRVGGKRLAAPPVGATDEAMPDLLKVAERYRALLDLGDQLGVVPQVEVWGFSRTLSRLGEAALVAIEAQHPKACILPDVYHLHRGGSGFRGIKLLAPGAIRVFHLNDFPAEPPRAQLTDADRVYPGDGVAPLAALLEDLADGGFRVMLSLELFNRRYWSQDPLTVARTGLEKMKALVQSSRARRS